MAAAAAARSVLRPAAILRRASSVAEMRSSASSFRFPTLRPSATRRFLRCPAQASFCLESMLPLHSANASALMTSMLSISKSGFGFLSQGWVCERFSALLVTCGIVDTLGQVALTSQPD
ncbi:nuclear fusion defective 6 [Rhynchospora pubera]|uniref:Nuclear fusion defective 6 n=1 Tax=Rhynchospora pubera TaxID=906938 RepID=A0AAV8DH48_9POAL|nr:nuclear fusion defective 6 [Rhynchospora pubera]